ncbi:MAG: methionine biosynthesis protein MetW [Pseudomonadota bacterium]
MRVDLKTVEQWVVNDAHILDLGCGDGTLLAMLNDKKNVNGVGVEINPEKIQACIEKHVQVIEVDMSIALENCVDNGFDVVIMTQSLQVVRHPNEILDHVLRVGKEAIIAFPNFAHWSSRLYLASKGKMPVSKNLPFSWFDTPNIHFFTLRDFEEYCKNQGIEVLDRCVLNSNNKPDALSKFLPNVFGSTAIYRIKR